MLCRLRPPSASQPASNVSKVVCTQVYVCVCDFVRVCAHVCNLKSQFCACYNECNKSLRCVELALREDQLQEGKWEADQWLEKCNAKKSTMLWRAQWSHDKIPRSAQMMELCINVGFIIICMCDCSPRLSSAGNGDELTESIYSI